MKAFFVRLLQLIFGAYFFGLCLSLIHIQKSPEGFFFCAFILPFLSGFLYLCFGKFNPKYLYDGTILTGDTQPSRFYKIVAFSLIASLWTGILNDGVSDGVQITGMLVGASILLGFAWYYIKCIMIAYRYGVLWSAVVLFFGIFGAIPFYFSHKNSLSDDEKRTLKIFNIPLAIGMVCGLASAILLPKYQQSKSPVEQPVVMHNDAADAVEQARIAAEQARITAEYAQRTSNSQ